MVKKTQIKKNNKSRKLKLNKSRKLKYYSKTNKKGGARKPSGLLNNANNNNSNNNDEGFKQYPLKKLPSQKSMMERMTEQHSAAYASRNVNSNSNNSDYMSGNSSINPYSSINPVYGESPNPTYAKIGRKVDPREGRFSFGNENDLSFEEYQNAVAKKLREREERREKK